MAVIRVHDLTEQTDGAGDAVAAVEYEQRLASLRAQTAAAFMSAPSIPTVRLNSGYEIPILGLGTWKSSAENEAEKAVRAGLECGYRHIDCAKVYENEADVGKALGHCFKYGPVKREEVFVTSKLWIDSHAKDQVREACLKSLSDLQLDYLDLYLIHWPAPPKKGPVLDPPIKETWLAMEKLVEEGLVRSVGISNFTIKKIKDLLEYCNIVPAVNQVELHPLLRQDELVEFCKDKGIHVTAYSPLGSPDSAPIFDRYVAPDLLGDARVSRIAEKLGKDNGQVLIRWGLQRDTSVLVKSAKPARIQSNLDVLDWKLSDEDFQTLSSFDIQFRMLSAEILLSPEGPYKTLTDLWDDPEEELRMEKYLKSLYVTDAPCPRTELQSGLSMPLVGLGTWRSEPNKIKEAVLTAIRSGYRHIDCAEIYENEHEVGEALDQIFREGIVEREELWITSKLWNSQHAADSVLPALQKSLSNLKLDYLDLYLMHWPITGNIGPEVIPTIQETWQAMEKLVEKGLVKAIGVSNFSTTKLEGILSYATVKPAVCQVEIHPYLRNDNLIEWCKEHGIHVTAYSALGGAPENEQLVRRSLPKLLENPVLEEIAQKVDKSKGQVLIRWALQHGTSVLAKSIKAERIKMNYDVHDWQLSLEDYNALSSLEPQTRMLDGSFFLNPKGPYTSVAELWDE